MDGAAAGRQTDAEAIFKVIIASETSGALEHVLRRTVYCYVTAFQGCPTALSGNNLYMSQLTYDFTHKKVIESRDANLVSIARCGKVGGRKENCGASTTGWGTWINLYTVDVQSDIQK